MRWKMAAFLAGGLLVFLVIQLWPASYALTGPGVIRITDREVSHVQVDVGEPELGAGDVDITRRLLYNRNITQKAIGHAEVVCTHTTRTLRNCTGTFQLPEGKIFVGGTILYRQFFVLAVLGGTGIYDNVQGTLTATALPARPKRESLLLFRLTV